MEKRYITIIIDSITDLNTTNFEIEVSFSVFDDHPDFIELAVESSTQQGISQHDTKLVEMKDDVKSYKGTLKNTYCKHCFQYCGASDNYKAR
jgi:hypothetical protein